MNISRFKINFLLVILPWLPSFAAIEPVSAQSIEAAADGTMTLVTKDGQRFIIDGGTLSGDGKNLFHSFKEFGLDAGEIATFLANPAIQNILSRVNGGNPSVIDGLIEVVGGNSNLYLMNPAGIIFGSNASLNVSGDFTATTATRIGFDDKWFKAFGDNDYASLVGNPNQFQFQGENGVIINAGELKVDKGSNITLIGQTVLNTGEVSAAEGKILITSVPGTSRVKLSTPGSILSLEIELPEDKAGNQLEVTAVDLPTLLTGSKVETGLNISETGEVSLNNSNVVIPSESGTTIISGEVSVSSVEELAGEITITGDRVALIEATVTADGELGGGKILVGGEKQGLGDTPRAEIIYVDENSKIGADGLTSGDGGEVIVFAEKTARIYGDISARGNEDGGFVETSGKEYIEITKTPDVSSAIGEGGEWLIDPHNIDIVAGNGNLGINNFNPFAASGDDAQLGVILIQNALTGGADVTISTGTTGTQDGDINVLAPIDYDGTGNNSLTLQAARNIIVSSNGSIFDSNTATNDSLNLSLLADFDSDDIGSVVILGNIATNGGSISIDGSGFTDSIIDSSGISTIIARPGIDLSANLNSSGGNIDLIGDSISNAEGIRLNSGSQIFSGGGNITINALTNSNTAPAILNNAQINSNSGNISLNGSSNSTIGVNQGGDIISNGGDINLTGTSTATVSFDGVFIGNSLNINSGSGDITVTSDSLDINPNAIVTATGTGDVKLQPFNASNNFLITGTELVIFNNGFNSITIGRDDSSGIVGTTSNLTINDPLIIQSPNGIVVVNGDLTGQDNASLTLDGGTTLLNADITTAGNPITIGDNILLGNNVILSTNAFGNAGADINILGSIIPGIINTTTGDLTLGGIANDLTFNAGNGNITLNGDIGASNLTSNNTALNNLIINSANSTTINSNNIVTTNDQTYNSPVTIAGNTTLRANDITFNSTVNSLAGSPQSLELVVTDITITTSGTDFGSIFFNDAVGNISPLSDLIAVTSTSGNINIAGGTVTTTGDQNYISNQIILTGDTSFIANGDFDSTLILSSGFNVDITALNISTDINTSSSSTGIIGGNINLTAVDNINGDLQAGDTNNDGGEINATANNLNLTTITTNNNNINLNGAVNLTNNSRYSTGATTGGNINFASTIDGVGILTLETGTGTINFNGEIGSITPIGGLIIENTSNAVEISQNITTNNGDLTFSTPVIITTNPVTLSTGTGNITFNNQVDVTSSTLTLISDSTIQFPLSNSFTGSGGNLFILAATPSQDIFLEPLSTTSGLSIFNLNSITGFSQVAIGNSDSSLGNLTAGNITVDNLTTFNNPASLNTTGDLALNNNLTGTDNLTLSAGNIINNTTSSNPLVVNGTGILSLSVANSVGGASNPLNLDIRQLNATLISGDLFLNNDSDLQLGASNVLGNANISAAGNITNLGAFTVGGNSTFTTTLSGSNINLSNLDVAGLINLSTDFGGNITISSSSDLNLGTVNTGGELLATSAGDINTNGIINGNGTDIILNAQDDINLAGNVINPGGLISLTSNAGSINGSSFDIDSSISSSSLSDTSSLLDGGDINLTATNNINLNQLNSSSDVGNGGDITATTSFGNIILQTINTQGTNLAGDVKLTSQGNIRVNLIQTGNTLISEDSLVGSQGDIEINAQRNIVIGSINSQSDGNGAIVNISSETGTINITGGIDLGSGSGTGGEINLTAQRDIFLSGVFFVDTGTLDAGKVNIFSRTGNIEGENSALRAAATTEFGLTGSVLGNGGIITVQALQDITLGEISTFSENFEGGDVEITSTNGSIELALINTQGNTRGGDVTLDAQNGFIRLTNTFLNSNGNNTSISTTSSVAGNGGSVTIRHGGQGIVPFVVGDGTGEIVTNNGTLGLIDTGNSIIPPDSYPFTQEVGNIRVISIDNVPEKNITDEVQRNSDPTTTDADSLTLLTPSSTIPTANLESAKEILTSIAENTGIKPAIVYVDFAPTGVSQTSLENREAKLNAQYQEELSGISPDKGINVNPPPAPTDKLQLVLITEEGERVPVTVPITREEILAEANKLYQEVAELGQNYLEPAKKLYKWLFAPIEAELEAQGIQNVLYIMPEGLRLIPLAALYDENSNQYLAQKYSAGYSPSLSLTDTRYKDIKDAQVLAFGASTFEAEEDQNELPAVKIEIPLIAGEILPGKFFLDQEFTQEKLLAARQENPFPIIHLATHADFQQEDNSQTYIQLYDNKLSYDQLRSLNLSNPPVELMVISACRSAFGDREAELGFGGLAAQLGVKTVVASLWYVGDTGTLALMSEFYRELKQAPIKAEALRQAQIAMITGEVKKESDKIISLRGGTTRSINLPSESAAVEEDLSHPFYWAAFTMIGSPW